MTTARHPRWRNSPRVTSFLSAGPRSRPSPRRSRITKKGIARLLEYGLLANARLDAVTTEKISGYIRRRQDTGLKVSSVNRELQVLRRMFALAIEWGKVDKMLPRVRMVPGEAHRDRVLDAAEQKAYLDSAQALGNSLLEAYQRARSGIRATKRGETPIEPPDPFLLRDVVTILLDCGYRPEECFRLRWEYVQSGVIEIPHGKTDNARRRIPLSQHVASILEMRRADPKPLDLSGSDCQRAYRAVQLKEATSKGMRGGGIGTLSALHFEAHVPDGLGAPHGPLDFGLSGWSPRHVDHQAIHSSAGAYYAGGYGQGARRTGWAQFWAQYG